MALVNIVVTYGGFPLVFSFVCLSHLAKTLHIVNALIGTIWYVALVTPWKPAQLFWRCLAIFKGNIEGGRYCSNYKVPVWQAHQSSNATAIHVTHQLNLVDLNDLKRIVRAGFSVSFFKLTFCRCRNGRCRIDCGRRAPGGTGSDSDVRCSMVPPLDRWRFDVIFSRRWIMSATLILAVT